MPKPKFKITSYRNGDTCHEVTVLEQHSGIERKQPFRMPVSTEYVTAAIERLKLQILESISIRDGKGVQQVLPGIIEDLGEPAAYILPLRYGSRLSFTPEDPPKEIGDGTEDWYCVPLYRLDRV